MEASKAPNPIPFARTHFWLANVCLLVTALASAFVFWQLADQRCESLPDQAKLFSYLTLASGFFAACFLIALSGYGRRRYQEYSESLLAKLPIVTFPVRVYLFPALQLQFMMMAMAVPIVAVVLAANVFQGCRPFSSADHGQVSTHPSQTPRETQGRE